MSTTSSDALTATPDHPATPPRRKVGAAWVVTGLSLGACAALTLMWRTEVQRAAYWQSQVEPIKAEAARYRVGLQEEIARTMRLAEELKSRQEAAVSVR